MKNSLKITVSLFVILYAVCLIIFFKDISEYVKEAVSTCLNVIIPSLYGFMIISGFITSSGLYRFFSKPFGWVARHIFKLPEDLFTIFLTSLFAGYPVGAKMLGELYNSGTINKATAERMLGFCYMGGPAFFCGIAGLRIYSNLHTGIIIYICILFSNLLFAVISGIKFPIPVSTKQNTSYNISSECFISSVYSGGTGILKICAAIIFFSSFTAIIEASGILINIASLLHMVSRIEFSDCMCILKALLEISNIGQLSPKPELLPLVTALMSFGGFCVIFQTSGFIPKELSTHIFYFSRVIIAVLSYLCCKIVIYFIGTNVVIPTMVQTSLYRQNSPIPSIFLLIMTILLLSNNFIAKSKKM